MPLRQIAALTLAVLVALAGCSRDSSQQDQVLVMAAASLTDAFDEVVAAFEAENPGTDVQLNLAGSSSLREQILEGAPADVFASANEETMQAVVTAGEATGRPVPFATNTLVIAVPASSQPTVNGVVDLADPDLLVGLCAEGVPCGDFARQALAHLGVDPSVDTNEPDVRALLTKIAADELDAGIVYATDVRSNDAVDAIALDPELDLDITYPIVTLTQAPNPEGAAAFVAFVGSEVAQSILERHGFGSP